MKKIFITTVLALSTMIFISCNEGNASSKVKKENVEVVSLSFFDIASDLDIGKVDQDYLFEVLSKIDLSESDALFVSCTALPVLSLIDKLEKKLGKIVLSSNQTLIWDTLIEINYNKNIEGFGQLFKN